MSPASAVIGDVIQIIDEAHAWYPALLIVDEVKAWGVQAYVILPRSNDGSTAPALAYTRLGAAQIVRIGHAAVWTGMPEEEASGGRRET